MRDFETRARVDFDMACTSTQRFLTGCIVYSPSWQPAFQYGHGLKLVEPARVPDGYTLLRRRVLKRTRSCPFFSNNLFALLSDKDTIS